MANFSVNCPFLFPNFAPTWWKKLGSQAATSSSMGTLAVILAQTQESNAIFKTKNDLKLCYENSLQKTQSKPQN